MGLGRLLNRSTVITQRDTVTGATAVFPVVDNIAPDWASSDAYRGAMTIPGAWRGAVMLSELLGGIPWHAYRQGRAGTVPQIIDPDPPLLDQPNPPDTGFTSWAAMALDRLWHGNALMVIAARNGSGWPTAAIPVPAEVVGVRRVTRFIDSPLPIGALEYQVGEMVLSSRDVIHFKGPSRPGAVRGMGILEQHFNTINLSQEQMRQARSISNHGVPTGVLNSTNPDLSDAEAANLKAGWLANQYNRTVAVLNATTTFQPLSWNPEEMQLIEARKFSLTDWELIFGLPVGWLGGQTSSRTYSNIEQDAINLLKFTLSGHVKTFEQTLSLAFPRGTTVRGNLDTLLRSDTFTRYQAHALALGNVAWKTVDEVRETEGLAPLPAPLEPQPGDLAQLDQSQPELPPIKATAEVGAPATQAIQAAAL